MITFRKDYLPTLWLLNVLSLDDEKHAKTQPVHWIMRMGHYPVQSSQVSPVPSTQLPRKARKWDPLAGCIHATAS
jgi:hypothetical protein